MVPTRGEPSPAVNQVITCISSSCSTNLAAGRDLEAGSQTLMVWSREADASSVRPAGP